MVFHLLGPKDGLKNMCPLMLKQTKIGSRGEVTVGPNVGRVPGWSWIMRAL